MNKTKKIAIFKITLVSVLTALLLLFSFISFDGYAGFFNAIQKGTELEQGIYANYNVIKPDGVSDEDFEEDFNNTFLKIQNLVEQKGYQGAVVFKGSNNMIRIESPDVDDASALLTEIGAGLLKIRTSDDSSAEVKISGDDIEFAVATTSEMGYWGTYIKFTEEAAAVLFDLTKDATESSPVTLYFYRGNSDSNFFYLPIRSQIKNNKGEPEDFLFISSSTGDMTQEHAVKLAITVLCGSMPATVEIQGEVSNINPLSGAMLGLIITLAVLSVLILVLFGVLYKELGLMVCLSILFYMGAMLFLMQALPTLTLHSASLGAILIGLILISALNLIVLEKTKKEYANGKKLNIAVKTGYKKSINVIADISGALTLFSLIGFLISTGILKSFMLILLAGSLVACFTTLLITYKLFTAYTVFNKNNGKKVNFIREVQVDEME